jgi:hypothetical protein
LLTEGHYGLVSKLSKNNRVLLQFISEIDYILCLYPNLFIYDITLCEYWVQYFSSKKYL